MGNEAQGPRVVGSGPFSRVHWQVYIKLQSGTTVQMHAHLAFLPHQSFTLPLGRRTEPMDFLLRPILLPRVKGGNRTKAQSEFLFATRRANIDSRYHTVIQDRLVQ
jgi:hypothetical protein